MLAYTVVSACRTGVRCLQNGCYVLADMGVMCLQTWVFKIICADLNLGRPTFRKTQSNLELSKQGGGGNTESGISELKGFFAVNYRFLFNDGFTGG